MPWFHFYAPQSPHLSSNLCGSLPRLGHSLLDLESPLLLEDHDLEAVEVAQSPSELLGGDLLGVGGLGPLGLDAGLLPELGNGAGAGAAGKGGDGKAGEGDVGESERLAGDGSVGGIEQDLNLESAHCRVFRREVFRDFADFRGCTHALVINDLDDNGQLASRRAVVQEDDAANLDEANKSVRTSEPKLVDSREFPYRHKEVLTSHDMLVGISVGGGAVVGRSSGVVVIIRRFRNCYVRVRRHYWRVDCVSRS